MADSSSTVMMVQQQQPSSSPSVVVKEEEAKVADPLDDPRAAVAASSSSPAPPPATTASAANNATTTLIGGHASSSNYRGWRFFPYLAAGGVEVEPGLKDHADDVATLLHRVADMRDVVAFTTDGTLFARVKPRSLWKKDYKEAHQGTYVRLRTNDVIIPPKGHRITDILCGKGKPLATTATKDGASTARTHRPSKPNGSSNGSNGSVTARRLSPLRSKSSKDKKSTAKSAASDDNNMSAADVLAMLSGPSSSSRSVPAATPVTTTTATDTPQPVPYSTALSLPLSLPAGHPLAYAARGWRFYPGVDSPGGDDEPLMTHLANDITALMDEADRRPGIVAFHTRGVLKKSLALKRDWVRPMSASSQGVAPTTAASAASTANPTPTPTATTVTITPPGSVAPTPQPPSPRQAPSTPAAPSPTIEHGLYVRLTIVQPRAPTTTQSSRQLSSPLPPAALSPINGDEPTDGSAPPTVGSPPHVPPPLIASAIPNDIGVVPTSPSRRRRLLGNATDEWKSRTAASATASSPRAPAPPAMGNGNTANPSPSTVLLSPATVAHAITNSPLSRRGVRPKLHAAHKYAELRLTRSNIIAANNDFIHFDPIDLGPQPRDFAVYLLSRAMDLNDSSSGAIRVFAVDHASLITSNLTPELHFRYTADGCGTAENPCLSFKQASGLWHFAVYARINYKWLTLVLNAGASVRDSDDQWGPWRIASNPNHTVEDYKHLQKWFEMRSNKYGHGGSNGQHMEGARTPGTGSQGGNSPVHASIHARGNLVTLKKMLTEFAPNGQIDIETRNGDGYTALHCAAMMGPPHSVEYMRACIVEGRASLIPTDADNNNVLHLCCQRGDEAAIELLLADGLRPAPERLALLSQSSINGQTPVQLLQDAATFYTSGASVTAPQANIASYLANKLRAHHTRIRAAVLAAGPAATGQTLAGMAAALKRRPSTMMMTVIASPGGTTRSLSIMGGTNSNGPGITHSLSASSSRASPRTHNPHNSQQPPAHHIGAGGSATAERASRRARSEREAASGNLLPALRPRTGGHARSPTRSFTTSSSHTPHVPSSPTTVPGGIDIMTFQ